MVGKEGRNPLCFKWQTGTTFLKDNLTVSIELIVPMSLNQSSICGNLSYRNTRVTYKRTLKRHLGTRALRNKAGREGRREGQLLSLLGSQGGLPGGGVGSDIPLYGDLGEGHSRRREWLVQRPQARTSFRGKGPAEKGPGGLWGSLWPGPRLSVQSWPLHPVLARLQPV